MGNSCLRRRNRLYGWGKKERDRNSKDVWEGKTDRMGGVKKEEWKTEMRNRCLRRRNRLDGWGKKERDRNNKDIWEGKTDGMGGVKKEEWKTEMRNRCLRGRNRLDGWGKKERDRNSKDVWEGKTDGMGGVRKEEWKKEMRNRCLRRSKQMGWVEVKRLPTNGKMQEDNDSLPKDLLFTDDNDTIRMMMMTIFWKMIRIVTVMMMAKRVNLIIDWCVDNCQSLTKLWNATTLLRFLVQNLICA